MRNRFPMKNCWSIGLRRFCRD